MSRQKKNEGHTNKSHQVQFKPLEAHENKSILQDGGSSKELLNLFKKQYQLAEKGLPNYLKNVVDVMVKRH